MLTAPGWVQQGVSPTPSHKCWVRSELHGHVNVAFTAPTACQGVSRGIGIGHGSRALSMINSPALGGVQDHAILLYNSWNIP